MYRFRYQATLDTDRRYTPTMITKLYTPADKAVYRALNQALTHLENNRVRLGRRRFKRVTPGYDGGFKPTKGEYHLYMMSAPLMGMGPHQRVTVFAVVDRYGNQRVPTLDYWSSGVPASWAVIPGANPLVYEWDPLVTLDNRGGGDYRFLVDTHGVGELVNQRGPANNGVYTNRGFGTPIWAPGVL